MPRAERSAPVTESNKLPSTSRRNITSGARGRTRYGRSGRSAHASWPPTSENTRHRPATAVRQPDAASSATPRQIMRSAAAPAIANIATTARIIRW